MTGKGKNKTPALRKEDFLAAMESLKIDLKEAMKTSSPATVVSTVSPPIPPSSSTGQPPSSFTEQPPSELLSRIIWLEEEVKSLKEIIKQLTSKEDDTSYAAKTKMTSEVIVVNAKDLQYSEGALDWSKMKKTKEPEVVRTPVTP